MRKHVVAEFSLTPLGVGESVSAPIARALEVVEASGLPYELNPMGTCIEGPWDRVLATIERCVEVVGRQAPRVSILVKIDWRKDAKPGALAKKVRSVRAKMKKG